MEGSKYTDEEEQVLEDDAPEEEGEDEAPTADQRAAVAREMSLLLASRVSGLGRDYVSVCQQGLKADANLFTSWSEPKDVKQKKKLEKHEPKVESYAQIVDRRRAEHAAQMAAAHEAAQNESGSRTITSNDSASLLRRFDELSSSPRRLGRRASTANAEPAALSASHKLLKREQRLDKLRQWLHEAEAKLMNRMVDNVRYHHDDRHPPFELPARKLLRLVASTMRCPYSEQHFRHHLLLPLSCNIVTNLFWYIHCYFFQANTERDQQQLLATSSGDYVRLLASVTTNKDYFFEAFPYAIAHGVRLAFHHFVPGSRSRYTPAWRLQVYVMVVRILCGMDVCAVTVQRMVETLFPHEGPAPSAAAAVDEGATKATRLRRRQPARPIIKPRANNYEAPPLPGDSWSQRVSTLLSVPTDMTLDSCFGDTSRPSTAAAASIRSQPTPMSRGGAAAAALQPLDSASVTSAGSDDSNSEPAVKAAPPAQSKQARKRFGAGNVSKLVQQFLNHPSTTAGRQQMHLKRTTPVPWVRVGGVDTFHAVPLKASTPSQQPLFLSYYDEFVRDMRRDLGSTLKGITNSKETVLHGGVSAVSKFCLDLSQERQERMLALRKSRAKRRASGGAEDDAVPPREQLRNQREKLLDAALSHIPRPSALTSTASLPALGSGGLAAEYGITRSRRLQVTSRSRSQHAGNDSSASP